MLTSSSSSSELARSPLEGDLRGLFDPGTLCLEQPVDRSGVLVARGMVDGTAAAAYAADVTGAARAWAVQGWRRIADAIDATARRSLPITGIWRCNSIEVSQEVANLDAIGEIYRSIVRASGSVAQLSVVLGTPNGTAAYAHALTDIVIMDRLSGRGRSEPLAAYGVAKDGASELRRKSLDDVHICAANDQAALGVARRLLALLGRQGPGDSVPDLDARDPSRLLPERSNRAYDVRLVVGALLDPDAVELQAHSAPNVVTMLGRLAGRTVGVVANNPLRLGGCLDALGAEKAARFVRMCDSLGVPLVVLVDVPGYLPGVRQEWDGVVRRGATLLYAFGEAIVPRVTVVLRKAYGGAYIAMNSRALGATAVFAWPSAEIAVMGAAAAVDVLHRRRLAAAPPDQRARLRAQLLQEQHRLTGGLQVALDLGAVDEVICPAETRRRVAQAIAAPTATRGAHSNIPL